MPKFNTIQRYFQKYANFNYERLTPCEIYPNTDFFGPYFAVFRLNTEIYRVFGNFTLSVQSRIQNPVKHLRLELFSQNVPSFCLAGF